MKVTVCGKGGSGKSTVAAPLACEYAQKGRTVLVVDTDESNLGLHHLLRTGTLPDLMGYFRGKGAVIEKIMTAMPDSPVVDLVGETWTIDVDGVPCDYVTLENEVPFIAIEKIHGANEGCACPMGMLTRQFLDHPVGHRNPCRGSRQSGAGSESSCDHRAR